MKTIKDRFREGAYGSVQMISAFVFVAIVGLIAILAGAEKKGEAINTIATVLGAGGQVFFAYMVWRLSSEQFAFAKHVSERQNRIASFSSRSHAISNLESWWVDSLSDPNDGNLSDFFKITQSLKSLFNDDIHRLLDELAEQYIKYCLAFNEMKLYEANKASFVEMLPLRTTMMRTKGDVLMAKGLALAHMHKDMRIEGPNFHSDSA